MSLQRIQTCEGCGKWRELADRDSPEMGGWRRLNNHDTKSPEVCFDCLRAAEDFIRARRASIAASEADS